jgi:hypothetical protein
MSTRRKLPLIAAAIALIRVSAQSEAHQTRGMGGAQPHHHDGKTTSQSGRYSRWSAGGPRTKPNMRTNSSPPPQMIDVNSVTQGARIRF